jgi:hypothetical protein
MNIHKMIKMSIQIIQIEEKIVMLINIRIEK